MLRSARTALLSLLVLVVIPARAQTVPPGTLDALVFRPIGPAAMSGRIVDLAVNENDPYVFYVASATGGVWKTVNNGVTFRPVFEREAVHSIGAIAVHPVADSVVWVGTGERANRQSSSWGNGVYRSTDGGTTWKHLGLEESRHIGRIALDPVDPDIAFVAAMGHLWGPNPQRGLYRTTDGGATWDLVLQIDEDTGVVDVAIDPADRNVMFATAYQRRRRAWGFHGGGPGSGLYRSTDAGSTWTRVTEGLPTGDVGRIGISIYRGDPNIVYACIEQGWRYNASTAYGERRAGVYRSDDRGLHWTHMSDWNPRPMYASQILVDPSDPDRVYMMNSFSFSDDGGKSFTSPKQSLHGDDRILWVNPRDSRHLIKGDDGGVGISYDRGSTWLYVTSLPVSQFYRIDVDMRDPYWVYGGLQDNGSWAAPNATYRSEGILNEDWIRIGGGDGFVNRPHRTRPGFVYTASQYLGLSLLDLETSQRRAIRPDNAMGAIEARRNWDAWGSGSPEPELGNAMAPANWDGPLVLSEHDPNTLYAGTNRLWKSVDDGQTWESLGDLTFRTDRRWLAIMGQVPHDSTLSLDDGIPYWPTLTAIAESPLDPDLLYVGTDDGRLQITTDGGGSWSDRAGTLPGLPAGAWIAGIEASRHARGTAYVAAHDYRSDDYDNYLYVTRDAGTTWSAITGDLPAERVLRTVREDPRVPGILYLGTEFGLFLSIDDGAHWNPFGGGMPTVAVNDLVVHPRDNDLVVATHGRGVWILDDLGAIQHLGEALAVPFHLFPVSDARQIRYREERPHTGDMIYHGQNPPAGATIDYWLGEDSAPVDLTVLSRDGSVVRTLFPDSTAGLHRVVWDLRLEPFRVADSDSTGSDEPSEGGGNGRVTGPRVNPGMYTIRLRVGDATQDRVLQIDEDPRIRVPEPLRIAWTRSLAEVGDRYVAALKDSEPVSRIHRRAEELAKAGHVFDAEARSDLDETVRLHTELTRRLRTLYQELDQWIGAPTADQRSRLTYLDSLEPMLAERRERLLGPVLKKLNEGLSEEESIHAD